jgi:hypothetical protein
MTALGRPGILRPWRAERRGNASMAEVKEYFDTSLVDPVFGAR